MDGQTHGLLLYIVKLVEYPKAALVPWYANSDHNEQLFTRIRIGQHCGRRTNIDPVRIPYSMGKYNNLLNLEDKQTDVAKNIGRTRGKTVWKTDWNKNQDIDLPVLY